MVIYHGQRRRLRNDGRIPAGSAVTTGLTPEEIRANVREAIELHVEGLREEGLPVPEPASEGDYVSVSV